MKMFSADVDLEIGKVFEVAGHAVKIALSKDITELTRSHSGRVYDVGQIGSILKLHFGRRIIFCTVTLLRLQTDEEAAAFSVGAIEGQSKDKRVIEADLLGEAWWNTADAKLTFRRGISTYPLPLQAAHLITNEEIEELFRSAESTRDNGFDSHIVIGDYSGASRVSCRANIDKLFGQHCAVLGSTGSGKSSAVAVILHGVLERNTGDDDSPMKPQVVLIDPHGEYSTAFGDRAKVFQAYDSLAQGGGASNLALPYWLMSGDEFRSLIIGKTEFEATSQANIVYKALKHARMVEAGLVRSATGPVPDDLPEGQHPEMPQPILGEDNETNDKTLERIASFDRDKPRPFKLSEFLNHIVKRQCFRPKGDGWEPVTASEFQKDYASVLNKFSVLTSDSRINFLMSEFDSEDSNLQDIISQFISVDEEEGGKIKIVDISGLPNEVAGPLAGAIARLLFQYKLYQTREERETNPVLFVCEEAHRYVPNRGEAQYAVAQEAIRRIAREGRKYGIGLMLVSQRPADVEGTVISQCNSWIVLRLSNSSDQEHVSKFLPDNLSGMGNSLSSLPRQEAIFVGEAAAIPARIRLSSLREDQLPNSNDISFASGWSGPITPVEQVNNVVARMTD